MKSKKIISLALVLCMILSVLTIGAISAAAEEADVTEIAEDIAPLGAEEEVATEADDSVVTTGEELAGFWETGTVAADNITADEQAIFDKALKDLEGVDYEPKDVIATQTVAGKNYAFLCLGTAVVPDGAPYWVVITIYEDLEGNVKLEGIGNIDVEEIATLENIPEPGMGGAWESEAEENAAEVPEAVAAALADNEGVALSPIAILGEQVVAGMNYRLLCYGTLVVAEPVTNLYVVDVYVAPGAEGDITDIRVFDLASYIEYQPIDEEEPTEEETEAPTEKPTDSSNGKSPKTGTGSDTALVVMLILFAAAGAGVSVYALRKTRG